MGLLDLACQVLLNRKVINQVLFPFIESRHHPHQPRRNSFATLKAASKRDSADRPTSTDTSRWSTAPTPRSASFYAITGGVHGTTRLSTGRITSGTICVTSTKKTSPDEATKGTRHGGEAEHRRPAAGGGATGALWSGSTSTSTASCVSSVAPTARWRGRNSGRRWLLFRHRQRVLLNISPGHPPVPGAGGSEGMHLSKPNYHLQSCREVVYNM